MDIPKTLPVEQLTGIFRLLSDETRLRILAVLQDNELAVGELQKILGLGQSTLSTQLGLMKEQGLVANRKEGQKVYYRIPRELQPDSAGLPLLTNVLDSVRTAKWYGRDQRSLQNALRERAESSREFFNKMANQNIPAPGQTWKALALGMLKLVRGKRIVDLGCGNGRLTSLLAQGGNAVTGVDNSEEQIRLARELQGERPEALTFLHAAMENTRLPNGEFDLVVLSQSLHHAAKPLEVLGECHRLLTRGGLLLILDLLQHEEEWMHDRFGDFWLGFSLEELQSQLHKIGFSKVQAEITGGSKSHPEIEGILVIAEKD